MKHYLKIAVYFILFIGVFAAKSDTAVDFFRAVMIDNERAVKSLLQEGFDPNTPNPQGQVALFLAMREGSGKVAQALLAHPAIRIDAVNAANETPLMMASLRGNVEGAKQLLERGAVVNRPGWSPLHYAASGPSVPLVALLLERGADINALSPNRSTPLMMAAGYGAPAAVELLLIKGAGARAKNDKGLAAADFARHRGPARVGTSDRGRGALTQRQAGGRLTLRVGSHPTRHLADGRHGHPVARA